MRLDRYYFYILITLILVFAYFARTDIKDFASRSREDVIVSYQVEPFKKYFALGERLRFRSVREIKDTAHLNFIDQVYCKLDSELGFQPYDQEPRNRVLVGPTNGKEETKPRWFDGYCPIEPATCYMVSIICVDKPQPFEDSCMPQVVGPTFRCQ